jgi:proline dehydrogenase
MRGVWASLREARYALPGHLEGLLPGPSAAVTVRRCDRLGRCGLASTVGYFQTSDTTPEEIVAATTAVARLLAAHPRDVYLSVKAHPLGFDAERVRAIADAASEAGLALMLDAQASEDAGRVLEVVERLLPAFPGTGIVLPARWCSSLERAARLRASSARIRIVKGERADPLWGNRDIEANYLALVARLAGRAAPVAVATHDPHLADRALALLLRAGTPCELEQLRGLPRRASVAVARRLGVPVRVYLPFGPGWWSYALDKALARPYLLSWMIRDLLGSKRRVPTASPSPEAASASTALSTGVD